MAPMDARHVIRICILPVLAVFVLACGGTHSDEQVASADEQVLDLLDEERVYADALDAADEEEEHANSVYRNRLAIFSLGATMSDNLEWDVCQAGIPLERQAIEEQQPEASASAAPLWERYVELIDAIEALLCKEYAQLTSIEGRYIGPVGDFLVNQGDMHDGKPCSGSLGEFGPFPSDYHQSELWVEAFSSRATPNFCSDDDRLLAIFEYTEEAILKRGYFYQTPLSVGFNELREPPRLLEVAGRPAIVGIDVLPSQQVYLYAIERFPTDAMPGIYIFVLAGDSNLDLAQQIAGGLLP